ncbi:MAG TPA: hypothetical protein VLB46_19330 [Pyrinomonadaceae bacterium]|nr:hypothetical protein [Pyrinomonadaceae bacterium]
MIKALAWYLRHEVRPRIGSIFDSVFWIAAICGAIFGFWGAHLVPKTTTAGTIAIALLTYAAIALGFSLAGLTLVLTLPNTSFVTLLYQTKPQRKKHDSYSDLIFVFSWTAIVHWLIVFVSIVLVLFVNPQQPAFELEKNRLCSGVTTGLAIYALCQFLVTLITLAQVGKTYTDHLRGEANNKAVTQ